jgi:hypothetical protein
MNINSCCVALTLIFGHFIRVSYDVQGTVASGGGNWLLPMQQGQGFLNLWYKKKNESVL